MKNIAFCVAIAVLCASSSPGMDNAHLRGYVAECAKYESLHPRFAKAFAFMRRPDLADLPCGRYEIDGSNCWAMVQEASLKPFADENKYEVHRAFIDIQAPITGNETIGITEPGQKVFDGFNVEKDYVLFMAKGEPWTLKPGEFAIFFPVKGAHAPGLSSDGSRTIRKLVIKVRAGAGSETWKVPNWCPIVSEEKAVLPWIDKTWCGHVQGMCVSSNAIYFSFHDQIVKTDWYGRFQRRVVVSVHGGDICYWNGRVYTGVWLKPKKGTNEQWCGRISVYDAETLEPVKSRTLSDWHHGTDGITILDGVIYLNMGRFAPDKLGHKNWYGKFDAETLESIGEPFVVDHGEDSTCGSQNMTTDGTYIYSSYYTIDETAHTPNLIVYDKSFNVVAKYEYGWNHGMDFVPGGEDGAVRFAFCYTPNWMMARQQPAMPVQGVVKFAELKDGRFSDISCYGVFDKQIKR